ncbi:hypothetical protein KC315_g7750 [Hortaea werneckii]|nr:hypothetical protein KC315_g7750 [Hortaea werneckii]
MSDSDNRRIRYSSGSPMFPPGYAPPLRPGGGTGPTAQCPGRSSLSRESSGSDIQIAAVHDPRARAPNTPGSGGQGRAPRRESGNSVEFTSARPTPAGRRAAAAAARRSGGQLPIGQPRAVSLSESPTPQEQHGMTVAYSRVGGTDGVVHLLEIVGIPLQRPGNPNVVVKFSYFRIPNNIDVTTLVDPPIPDNNFSDSMGGGNSQAGTYWAGHDGGHELARTSNGMGGANSNNRRGIFFQQWARVWPGRSFDAPS